MPWLGGIAITRTFQMGFRLSLLIALLVELVATLQAAAHTAVGTHGFDVVRHLIQPSLRTKRRLPLL